MDRYAGTRSTSVGCVPRRRGVASRLGLSALALACGLIPLSQLEAVNYLLIQSLFLSE